jgi:adenine deaminase
VIGEKDLPQDQSLLSNTPLVDVAMGRLPADLVIRNGRWVSVQTAEIIPHTDIAVKDGRIAYIGPDAAYTIGEHTRVVDAGDCYLVPGLLDAHMHVESGMLTVTEFVRAVLRHGTTGMFVDPHEIANIFGLPGVRLMVDEAALQPIDVWVQVPSCIPSAPGFETPGAVFGQEEVAQALGWPGIIGLGEVMNFPGVFGNDPKMHAEISAARQAGKVIGGHYASPDLGRAFHAYAAGGPQDDHEGTTLQDAVARARQGMKVMMRFGSAWHDVVAQVKAVTELGLDSRNFLLCTDDSHCQTLVQDGHVNRAVRVAISQGVPPIKAIQMATINTADHFGVSNQVGMLAPGRWANFLLVSDLAQLSIDQVWVRGKIAVSQGEVVLNLPTPSYPDWARQSVRLQRPLTAADFTLKAPPGDRVTANVIGIIENQAPNRHIRLSLPVVAGEVRSDPNLDLAKIAVVERHFGSGRVQVGLVQGFGLQDSCAVASSIAHDSHHIIVAGTSEADMAQAVNELARIGGGQVVVRSGTVLGSVALPIAGIMSDQPAAQVAQQAASVLAGLRLCGCQINNPNMQLSLTALVVIPELRLSDLGLVDVSRFKFIPVLESEPA